MLSLQNNVIILFFLLGLSAFFSGSETALTSITRFRVQYLFDKNRPGSWHLKKLDDDPHRMLITILVGNNVVNITASVLATAVAYQVFSNNAVGIVIGIMTFLILVFGEIIPKTLATRYNEPIGLIVARIIWPLSIILIPLIKVWEKFDQVVTKGKQTPFITEEELKSIVKVGGKEGSIKGADLIHKVFRFDDINVKDIMTPKTDMKIISTEKKLSDALELYASTGFSRYPVYQNTRENIIGIIYIKDVIKKKNLKLPIKKAMNKAYFVPETKKIDSLLRQFQKKKRNMAMVVNEHGTITGLITAEDIVEEIVGEIMDETEKIVPEIKKTGKRSWVIFGKADIGNVNKKLRLKLKETGDFTTIGGYILAKAGKVPKEGEELVIEDLKIRILEADKKRIKKIRIEK